MIVSAGLGPNTARAAAYILQVERKIAEGAELEKRISNLETAVQGEKRSEPLFDADPLLELSSVD